MRFHVVGLPHTNTTSEFTACAFTEKVRKFCDMMKGLGHTVYLYGGTETDANCDELITCISERQRRKFVGDGHYTQASFDYDLPAWQKFNSNVVEGIEKRAEPTDFICSIGGLAHKQIADALPAMMFVEFGIGYPGTFAKYRVFESYSWMHSCYGSAHPYAPQDINGNWYDDVIPSYFEPEKFPFRAEKDDYYLFIGRLTARKGYEIAAQVCEKLGARLIVAGEGTPPEYGEYVGLVNEEERGALMSGAKAVFVPTIYDEPFGSVACEAMMCGTPVITTDWGAFTETVVHGVTGYRCRSFGEFLEAARCAGDLDNEYIHKHAVAHYSMDAVALRYQMYFERLSTLWEEGWYSELSWLSAR